MTIAARLLRLLDRIEELGFRLDIEHLLDAVPPSFLDDLPPEEIEQNRNQGRPTRRGRDPRGCSGTGATTSSAQERGTLSVLRWIIKALEQQDAAAVPFADSLAR
jgi:hypothetical protein